MTGFVDAGPADLAPGQCVRRRVSGRDIMLARSGDGRLCAVAASCSHAGLSLEGARVRGDSIVCPHHGARFCLTTGKVAGPPAIAGIEAFPTREQDGRARVMFP